MKINWQRSATPGDYETIDLDNIYTTQTWVNSQGFIKSFTNNYLTGISGKGNETVTFARQGLTSLTWDASHTHPYRPNTWTPAWSDIRLTPTTLADYGIADAYTKAQVDAKSADYLSSSHPASNVTTEKIGHWNTAYTQISQSKSYIEEITTTDWNSDKKYAVTVSGLKPSDTVILDGNNEIFAEYGLDAVIGTDSLANKLIFSVGVKPSNSITIKYSIIKTGSGT